jgi:hypothetical protein
MKPVPYWKPESCKVTKTTRGCVKNKAFKVAIF